MKTIDTLPLERILGPMSDCLTPESARAIVDFRIDASTQQLLDSLAEKSTAGALTDEERRLYQTYVSALDFVAILQSKARQMIKKKTKT